MATDQIADLLTRIRNASLVGHPSVVVPSSSSKKRVLEVIQREGYIESFEVLEASTPKPKIKVNLKYDRRGLPVIKEIRKLSTPGRRRYVSCGEIPQVKNGLGTVLVSTSQGVISGVEAKKLGVGGELICSLF